MNSGFDTEGEELPNTRQLGGRPPPVGEELFGNMDSRFQPGQEWRLEVKDEHRNPPYVIRVNGEEI
jgi:hypothetical protein